MAKILIVEDDIALGESILDSLKQQHVVELVDTGKEAMDRLKIYSYDLVILDWGLPDEITGVEVCRRYRSAGGTCSILMLTGRSGIEDKEAGLDCGADDYVTKPFNIRELLARVRALLRRPGQMSADNVDVGPLSIDRKAMCVFKNGERIELLPKEYQLLEFFIDHQNHFFSAETLLDKVWSSESDTSPDTVRVYINRLRSKIDLKDRESFITTRRNAGYMFKLPD